jgi:hypothetical protein
MPNYNIYPHELPEDDIQPSAALAVVAPEQHQVQLVPPTQLSDFFAPEQFFQCDDLEASRHFCAENFGYEQRKISVAQISLDDDLSLAVDNHRYHLTEKAHGDLCRLLHIPLTFSYDIPTDLTAMIVRRLKSDHQQLVTMVSRGDTIVALVDPLKWAAGRGEGRSKKTPHYRPVSNLSLLHLLEKVWKGPEVDTRITFSDVGMQVELLRKEESFTVEPVVGDVTRVGVAITNSETGGPLPLAKGYTLRLVCTNGSTVQTDAKLYRFSSDLRCSPEWRFNKFAEALQSLMQEMQAKCGALRTAYQRMAEDELDDVRFHDLYRQAQYLSRGIADSSDAIDDIFGVGKDDRQKFFKRVRERQNKRRDGTRAVIEPPQSTGLIVWDVFNGITAAARDEVRYSRRTALENLAGDVMKPFIPSMPSLN